MGRQTKGGDLSELRGSRRWTEDEGRRVIEAWRASGKAVPAFAKASGFAPQRVYWWRDRLDQGAKADGIAPAPAPAFVPVIVRSTKTASTASAAVTVCMRDGTRVEVTQLDAASAAWVATLVRSFEEVPS